MHLLKATSLWIGLLLLSHGCWSENPRVIELETGQASEISYTLAIISGSVVDVGESGLDAYGHCWSTSSNPTYDLDQKTQLGRCDTMGIYLSQLNDLLPETRYYVRSYAVGAGNVIYGNELSFSTLGNAIPVVLTTDAFNIDYTSASSGGTITDDRGSPVTAKGICWSKNPLPDINGQHTSEMGGSSSFTSNLNDLIEGESYYYRAYATNAFGTAYGEEKYFDTRLHAPEIFIARTFDIRSHTCSLEIEASGLHITQKGVCYSSAPNPTVDGNHTGQGATEGEFTVPIMGLVSNTTFYLRPYAINREATIYGDQVQVSTLPMVFDVWVQPDSIYNGCPADGNNDSPNCHELYNNNSTVWAEIEGINNSTINIGWTGEFNSYREETMDLNQRTFKGKFSYGISETQSIVLSFYLSDEDNLSSAEFLDKASESFSMSTILDLENITPTDRYSGSYTLPFNAALNGSCLDMTFRFEFTEK